MCLESNSCPVKYWAGTGCPGSGKCCNLGWTQDCQQDCAKKRCEDHSGTWIPRDYSKNPYTCEMGMLQIILFTIEKMLTKIILADTNILDYIFIDIC